MASCTFELASPLVSCPVSPTAGLAALLEVLAQDARLEVRIAEARLLRCWQARPRILRFHSPKLSTVHHLKIEKFDFIIMIESFTSNRSELHARIRFKKGNSKRLPHEPKLVELCTAHGTNRTLNGIVPKMEPRKDHPKLDLVSGFIELP